MQREEKKSKEKFLGLKTGKVETLGKFFKKGRVMLERDRILIPLCFFLSFFFLVFCIIVFLLT